MNFHSQSTRIPGLVLLIFILTVVSCKEQKTTEIPPPKVKTVEVMKTDVPIKAEFIGQTYGYVDIPIRARVNGFLTGIYFNEGSWVDRGQLLYTIDPEPYEAIVAEAMSKVAEAKTRLAKAESDLNRIRPLAEINAVSQSDLDAAEAQYGAAKAAVDAAEANLRYSKINLGYAKIYSPIRGIIGKTEAKVGEFVGQAPNPVVLNAVSRIDTILVQFSISESDYLRLLRFVQAKEKLTKVKLNGNEPRKANIEMILADGSLFPEKGTFDFINRQVDPTTGSLLVQVSFPNPDNVVRPGQFARLRIVVELVEDALIIPQRSVRELQGVYQAYVVNDEGTVESRNVNLGPSAGSMYIVKDGVAAGERIVFEGLQFARPGGKVTAETVEVPSILMNF